MITQRTMLPMLAIGLVTSMLLAGCAPATQSRQDRSMRLLAMIRTTSNLGGDIGAGVIIGASTDEIYIMTANHLIRPSGSEASSVLVYLNFLPGHGLKAEVTSKYDTATDVALIKVTGVSHFKDLSKVLGLGELAYQPDMARGTEVTPVGYPLGKPWYKPVIPGRIASVGATKIAYEANFIAAGQSGGGLFDRNWRLVGMLTRDEPPEGIAVRASELKALAKKWDVPVNLWLQYDRVAEENRRQLDMIRLP